MSLYVIGDVQGCYDALQRLLDSIRFDPASDQLWFVGDLVNRGGQSLATLRLVHSLRDQVVSVLGNHDLHLLAEAIRHQRRPTHNTELREVIEAADAESLLSWLQRRPLLHVDHERQLILSHAGIDPDWSLKRAGKLAERVHSALRGKHSHRLLTQMYGDHPGPWHGQLNWLDEMRCIINVFTRMRMRAADGRLEFNHKGPPAAQGEYRPWFEYPRKTAEYTVIFGHWSALGLYFGRQALALDSGCVWGGPLTAVRLGHDFALFQVAGHTQASAPD
ncbi:MAG: symmetrical bis(5'-nucleosyl)-tetraphosphatase [Wenzhouxiangellaceae bacterium]